MSPDEKRYASITALLTGGTVLFGALAWIATREGTDISRRAEERATGQAVPNFKVKCDTPHVLVRAGKAVDPKTVQVEITNEGPYNLKAIRCDISTYITWGTDTAEDQKITPRRFDHEFNEILKPGESTSVEILPEVVAYMQTINLPPGKDSYWAPCRVACSDSRRDLLRIRPENTNLRRRFHFDFRLVRNDLGSF